MVLLTLGENLKTLQELEERQKVWTQGIFPEAKDGMENILYRVISMCLAVTRINDLKMRVKP